jgi:hypothetical protein
MEILYTKGREVKKNQLLVTAREIDGAFWRLTTSYFVARGI